MKLNNERGVALVFTLFIVVVLLGFSSIFVMRTINESNIAEIERETTKAFYIAEGGGQNGLDGLDNLINNYMLNTINGMNPSSVINLATTNLSNGLKFLEATVLNSGTAALTLNGPETEATFDVASTAFGSGTYNYTITLTQKTTPVTVTPDTWDFPFNYRIESTGSAQGFGKEILVSGDFTVRVQRDNFAKYALFTNDQSMPSGSNVWFTDKTNFAGPIHTNGRYNIYGNPSGTFDGAVTQAHSAQTTRYYNNGWPVLLNADFNGTKDVPTFNAGFDRTASSIALSSSSDKQDMIDQAQGGYTYSSNGIYVPNDGSNITGGIYVKGNASVQLSTDASDNAVYVINQSGTEKHVTVDTTNNQTTVYIAGSGGGTTVYTGVPDGIDDVGTILYVDGGITSLKGTVQQDTALTIGAESDVLVTDHLQYANYTASVGTPGQSGYVAPSAAGTNNLLGVVTWNGDVRIGTAAPDDVNIHGTLLAQNGIFQVDSYNNRSAGPRGTATLLGGVITDNYGAFGLFSGSTGNQLSGYGRNFVYDTRMETGNAPPYFPSLNTFIAFTNDITDKMIWQEGEI